MTVTDPSIVVVQYGPVRAFEFDTHVFERFPLRLICPRTRENYLMSASSCALGAVLKVRPGCKDRLLAYLSRRPSEQ